MRLFNWGKRNFKIIRDSSGNWSYSKGSTNYVEREYLKLYLNESVLNTCINIGASYLSKYRFGVKRKDGTIDYEDSSLELFKNPNPFESKEDFLKKYYIFSNIYGYVYQLPLGHTGAKPSQNDMPKALYNLNTLNIEHDYDDKPFLFSNKKDVKKVKEAKFTYSDGDKDTDYKYSEIIPFYNTVNGVCEDNNPYTAPSKLLSLIPYLSNLKNSSDAENRALNKVGSVAVFAKEKSGNGDIEGFNNTKPLKSEEKRDLKNKFNDPVDRTLLPNKALDKLDLSIPIKNLGLDNVFSKNQGVIAQAFGLSNELYNYLTKGSTFENQEKAEVRYIQNYIDPIAKDLASSYTDYFGNVNEPFVATIDHAPTMGLSESIKADKASKISKTIETLVKAGFTKEESLNLINKGFDINLTN